VATPAYEGGAQLSPDGRFLLLRRDAGEGQLKLALNWTEELQRILGSGGVK
jgi:hypothetical protein